MARERKKTIYAVTFRDHAAGGKTLTVQARRVEDSPLGLGFVCVSDFVFPAPSGGLVDPEAEHLRRRLEGVERLHLQVYAVLAIEERGEGTRGLKLHGDRSKLVLLPGSEGPAR